MLTDENGRKYTITELDILQQEELKRKTEEDTGEEAFFKDRVTLYQIDTQHKLTETKEGVLAAYGDGFEICGERIAFADMQGMAIVSRNFMIVHIKGRDGHIELKSDMCFSALKYLYLYNLKTRGQE